MIEVDNEIKKTIEMFVDCLNQNGLSAFDYLAHQLNKEENKEAYLWICEFGQNMEEEED